MTVTAASLKARFPTAFPASFSDAVLDAAIAEAQAQNSATLWGSKYDLAVTYLASHLALLDAGAAASASGIKVAKAGSVSVEYDPSLSADASKFRAEYERLCRICTVGVFVSGGL